MIRGLLLAGGAATRFGSAKLLHPTPAGSTIGEAAARNLLEGVGNALAVVREGDAALAERLRAAGCDVLVTARCREGMGASISAGVAAARDAQGWVIALADMPRIAPAVSRSVAAALADGALVAVPALPTGERGHPVGFSAPLLAQLCALAGDAGARSIVARHAAQVVVVATEERGILYDVDRPSDLSGWGR